MNLKPMSNASGNESEFASKDDILRLAPKLENAHPFGFYGKSEAEHMIRETICAAKVNMEKHGEPYSIRGDGVFSSSGCGLCDNNSSYNMLLNDGMFVEAERGENIVIFPTKDLVKKLDKYYAKKEQG